MSILTKFTNGWKTIAGVVAVATLQSMFDIDVLSEWWFNLLTPYAYGLSAVGLTHKIQKFTERK